MIDLSTIPQEYVPYPPRDSNDANSRPRESITFKKPKCKDCAVHAGFMASWKHAQHYITPQLEQVIQRYQDYQLTLVGHSLGGAVAALAGLEYNARGWNPQVTTFGEPRIGNLALVKYINKAFPTDIQSEPLMYRRVTHAGDPVPLLPLSEWGYKMHAGEIYISKPNLSPSVSDIRHCEGDEDPRCIAGGEFGLIQSIFGFIDSKIQLEKPRDRWSFHRRCLTVPGRFRVWQLLFAHRDYFWRLGLCIPGGDPKNWHWNQLLCK